jgi:hypothetical protein
MSWVVWVLLASIAGGAGFFAEMVWANHRRRSAPQRGGEDLLGCGCPADGRPMFACLRCDHTRCDVHRDFHAHASVSRLDADVDATVRADDLALWEAECVKLRRLATRLGQVKR